jgi:hypothetical protein
VIHYTPDSVRPTPLCRADSVSCSGWASQVTCQLCKVHPDFPNYPVNEERHIALDEIERARLLLERASKRVEALCDDSLPEWQRQETLKLLYTASCGAEEALVYLDEDD